MSNDKRIIIGGGDGIIAREYYRAPTKANPGGVRVVSASETLPWIQFDIEFTDGSVEGRLQWNSEDGTLEFGLPGGNVTLQVGQELLVKCVNKTGVTITDGEIVYVSGASGSRPEIALADASDGAKDDPIGMATEAIAHNDAGYVNISGLVRGIDTSAIAVGDPGYLSAATPGALSATPSASAHHNTIIGYCIFSNASSGIFLVRVVADPDQFLRLVGGTLTGQLVSAMDAGVATPAISAKLDNAQGGIAAGALEDWHEIGATSEPGFQNSWVNVAGAFATAAFRKLPTGLVLLKGVIKTGNLNTIAMTLPAGYRPAASTDVGTFAAGGSTQIGLLRIGSAGGVRLVSGGADPATSFSIHTSFMAEG